MARLNEPAAPTESIETLKRKFLRQNRDIAKINSIQAIRIRALENEVSRLLTDNLNSRGHIIRLERELENNRSRHQHVDDLRSQMEEKLSELGALFKDFDGRPSSKKRKSSSPKDNDKMIRSTPAKSPGKKDWKNHCALGEAMPGQEGRFPPTLPAIMENKYYPRKTLEQDELAALKESADTTDSPELEPPPVSQFIDEDPVKIDFPAKTLKAEIEVPPKSPSSTTFSTAMLEQRRKRRESVGITDIRRLSGDEAMIHEITPDSLKVGAKRKVSVRDDAERLSHSQISPDDFKYTRKTIEEAPASKRVEVTEKAQFPREIATAKTTSREGSRERPKLATTQSNVRKALAPKPSNEDVSNSPRKKGKPSGPVLDEVSMAKKELSKSAPLIERPKSRVRKTENIPSKSVQLPVISKIDVLLDPACEPENLPDPEPETPAAQDIISPIFSEPSARPSTRDTPPPADIGHEGVTDHGRPGRRARASVSYAEPNLRDKMRRPTKELVDAVTSKPTTYIKIEDGDCNSTVKSSSKSVYIKPEPTDDDAWSSTAHVADPPSPLSGKAPIITQKSNPSVNDTQERRKSTYLSSSSTSSKEAESSTTRRARIEKLIEPAKTSRSTALATSSSNTRHSRNPAVSGLDKEMSKLEIHKSGESVDAMEPTEKIRKFVREEEEAGRATSVARDGDKKSTVTSSLKRNNSSSKRNSALPLQMQMQLEGEEMTAGEESDVEALGSRKTKGLGVGSTNPRRRSVAVLADTSTSGLASTLSVPDFRAGGRRGGNGGNTTVVSSSKEKEISPPMPQEVGGARQERVNARRRSMML